MSFQSPMEQNRPRFGANQGTPSPGGPAQLPPTFDASTPLGQYLTTNPDRRSAYDYLTSLMATYGLSNHDIQQVITDGMVQGLSQDEVVQQLRQTPTYKTRFKAIEQRQQMGLPPISEADVVSTERSYAQVLASAGLPKGFYDQPEDFTNFLVKDMSPTELKDRVVNGYSAAQNADPQTKAQLQGLFGIDEGHLAAYYLDPDKTEALLQKQLTEAQIGAAGVRSGYGQLAEGQLSAFAGQGITQDQAMTGFGKLASEQALFNALPGENPAGDINQQEQLGSVFDNNAAAQRRIQRRQQERQSAFGGGGEFVQSGKTQQTGAGVANPS